MSFNRPAATLDRDHETKADPAGARRLFCARRHRRRMRRDSIPGNAVAEVDGTAIEKADYEHWLGIAAKSGGPDATVPDPPDFTSCIAAAKKTAAQAGQEGQPKQTDADYKKQCQQQYDQLRDQVVGLLISFQWIESEAEEQGVKVTDAEVKKSFDQQKKQAFPKDADYEKFLKDSGPDERGRPPARAARAALEQDPRQGHQGQGQGHRRADQGVLRQEQGPVRPARAARPEHRPDQDEGARPRRPRPRSSPASRSRRSPSSTRSTTRPRRRAASCRPSPRASRRRRSTTRSSAAKKGELEGPVKTQFGYYVFEVDKVNKASQQSLDAGDADDQAAAGVAEPAEGAGLVRQGLPQALEGQDRLPRRLRDAGLQERAEGDADAHRRRGPARRDPDADPHARHLGSRG